MALLNSNWSKLIFVSAIILLITLIVIYKKPIKRMVKKIIPKGPVVVLKNPPSANGIKIILLHHSTGKAVWDGGIEDKFEEIRKLNNKHYYIIDQYFPYDRGNYPYDYWDIWVNHAGVKPYNNDPTLEMITQKYDVIIWKHCYPVCNIEDDLNQPDVSSSKQTLENYKLQYLALKEKMHQFPNTKFIVWTGAARVKNTISEEEALRAKTFFNWVREVWDQSGDNIFLWDFYELETEGGLYLQNKYAVNENDSHPNKEFGKIASDFLYNRILDVIENRGDMSNITEDDGNKKHIN